MTQNKNLVKFYITTLLFLLFSPSLFADTQTPPSPPAPPKLVDPVSVDQTQEAMVVTAHPEATQAALEILQGRQRRK